MNKYVALFAVSALALGAGTAVAGQEISNDMSRCAAGKGPAILVSVRGIKNRPAKFASNPIPQPVVHGSPKDGGCIVWKAGQAREQCPSASRFLQKDVMVSPSATTATVMAKRISAAMVAGSRTTPALIF